MTLAAVHKVTNKASYRKSRQADLWHFCVNCEDWPLSDFIETAGEQAPPNNFCPRCVRKERGGKCQSSIATRALSAKRILIIEDNADVRRILTVTLRHLGYLTLEAKDASDGIKMSLTEIPDLILMDISLPDLSGLDTARRIKDNPKTSQIPIVACSGWKDEDIITKALEVGVAEFLTKPISPERVAELIEKLT